jgi:hypothetical protein
MKNIIIGLLVIAIAWLSALAYRERSALRQQQRQVQELTAKLRATTDIANVELQEKCAQQAHEFLSQFITRNLVETRTHFNESFNRCFVETRTVGFNSGSRLESVALQDAADGKDYGSYALVSEPAKTATPSVTCKVMLPSGNRKTCHSMEEFDAFANQYME